MKCFVCNFNAKTYTELAKHIIDNSTTHTNQGMLDWAKRYNVGLRTPPKQYEPKVYKPSDGICKVCHKSFEGGKPNEVCQC